MDTSTATIMDTRSEPITKQPEVAVKPLTGQSIVEWVKADDQAGQNRFEIMLHQTLELTVDEVKTVFGNARKLVTEKVDKKTVPLPGYKSVMNRCSELRQMYGAIRFCGADAHEFVAAGRVIAAELASATLKEYALRWDGEADTPEAQARREEARKNKAVAREALKSVGSGISLEEAVSKAQGTVQAEQAKTQQEKAVKVVERFLLAMSKLGFDGEQASIMVAQMSGLEVEVAEVQYDITSAELTGWPTDATLPAEAEA